MTEQTATHVFSAEERSAERRAAFDYWLAHSEGFRVESPNGRIGLVQDVRCSLESGEANVLVLRSGKLGLRLMTVLVGEVEAVVPRQRRLVLRENPQLAFAPDPPRRRAQLRLIRGRA